MRRIWFIDDKQENREAWGKGFGAEIKAHCELKSFDNWPGLRHKFENKAYPDVLFLDFFIGDHYGHEIIKWIDVHCPNDQRPVLVAHSSMEAANIGMCEKGANCRLEKVKGETISSSIQSHFKVMSDIEYLVEFGCFEKDNFNK